MDLRQKTAIITGGTGALGSAVAREFFDAGANIAIPYHSEKSTSTIPKDMIGASDRLLLMQTDLSSEPEVVEFVEHVKRKFRTVDFLANIAGGYRGGNPINEVSIDEWETMISMNLTSAFLICREAVKVMLPHKSGRIVNIGAMTAFSSGANKAPYTISKRGVIKLTEAIAEEVKGTGITANAIAPSIILTEANKRSMPDSDSSKWVTPKEIADVILFLCSDSARAMNGNVIRMFGGI